MPKFVPIEPIEVVNAPQLSWRERFFQPQRLLLWALLAAIPVLAPWVARQLPDLKTRYEYRLAFSQIQLEPAPVDGVPTDLIARVQRRSDLPAEVSLLDPTLPLTLGQAFAQHPWIARVIEVRNEYPASVTVRVEYRHPVAVVQVKSGVYPVDGSGVLLPPGDFQPADVEKLIPVRGVTTTPYAPEGRPWSDPAVLAAADLARYLGPRWKDLQLTAIIAPPPASADTAPDEIPLELETAGGSRILWGRTPDNQRPGELTGLQKLGRLEKYLAEFGRYDSPTGPYEIDIRHWEEISRRPLEATSTAIRRSERARR
jgi:hypothetical protein